MSGKPIASGSSYNPAKPTGWERAKARVAAIAESPAAKRVGHGLNASFFLPMGYTFLDHASTMVTGNQVLSDFGPFSHDIEFKNHWSDPTGKNTSVRQAAMVAQTGAEFLFVAHTAPSVAFTARDTARFFTRKPAVVAAVATRAAPSALTRAMMPVMSAEAGALSMGVIGVAETTRGYSAGNAEVMGRGMTTITGVAAGCGVGFVVAGPPGCLVGATIGGMGAGLGHGFIPPVAHKATNIADKFITWDTARITNTRDKNAIDTLIRQQLPIFNTDRFGWKPHLDTDQDGQAEDVEVRTKLRNAMIKAGVIKANSTWTDMYNALDVVDTKGKRGADGDVTGRDIIAVVRHYVVNKGGQAR